MVMNRKLWIVIGGAAVAVFAGLVAIGVYISPQGELRRSDAIVAVSGGDTHARTMMAVELYEENWAPRLIFSGAANDPEGPSNAESMRQIAIDQGVPPDVISIDELSVNTRENADEVAYIVQALEYDRIILVTSPYHQRRAYIEFRSQLGDEVEIINYSALDERWSRRGWWRDPFGWYITLSEVPKVLYTLFQRQP